MRHQLSLQFLRGLGWLVGEGIHKILLQVTRIEAGSLFIKSKEVRKGFKRQRVFVRPVFVDGGFADAGAASDCVHTGGANAAFDKQFDGCIEDFTVGLDASCPGHGYNWIREKRYAPAVRNAVPMRQSAIVSTVNPNWMLEMSAPRMASTPQVSGSIRVMMTSALGRFSKGKSALERKKSGSTIKFMMS